VRGTLTDNADGEDIVYPSLKNEVAETSGLIAVMAQWGLTADELLPVIDKVNKVADDYAITSSDLVAGLQRSSGAAKVLGLTLEETIAILTAMREATGRTGKEVGNALNSILSFMQRDKAIDTFESMGIAVFADEARTQFRNVIEIFDEMAAKWPQMGEAAKQAFTTEAEAAGLFSEEMSEAVGMQEQWNDMQQRDLSQAAAGVYRRNYLLALLQNWSKVDEVLISQENALGYSMKENERTMQTLEKQIEVLRASAEQLAVALGDAGLLNELTALVEGMTDVVQWFNGLDDSMQTLILTAAEVMVVAKLLSAALKGLGVSGAIAGVGGLMAGWAVPIGAATVATRTLMSALTGITVLLSNIGKGMIAAFGGPVVASIIAVATAYITLARNAQRANDELIAHGEMAEGLSGEYDRLTEKLDSMAQGTDEYNQTAKELGTLKGQIADSIPELIDGWDEETDSIKINRAEMDKLISTSNDLKKSQEQLEDSLENSMKTLQAEVAEHAKNAQEWESEKNVLEDLAERREDLTKVLARQKEGSEEAKKTQDALGETERLMADIAQEAGLKRNATVDEIIAKLNELKIGENQAVINTQNSELKKVKAVKNGALARVKIIEQEIAAYGNPMEWGFFEATGNFVKTMFGQKSNLAELEKEKNEKIKIAQDTKKQIDAIEKAIKQSQRNIAGINADITPGGGPPAPGSGSAGSSVDAISESLKQLADSSKMFEVVNYGIGSTLQGLDRQLGTVGAEYDYLNSRVEAGTATSANYARMQELIGAKMGLVKREQDELTNANTLYQQQINALNPLLAKATAEYERFKAAGDSEHMKDAQSAVKDLQGEIDSLSSAIASNTQKIWENKGALEQLATTAYSSYYQSMTSWMQHMESIGRLGTQQQLEYLNNIDETKLKQSEAWQLEEDRFSERRALLDEEMDKIKAAYDERMSQYEDEIEANDHLIERKEEQAEAAVSAIDDEIAAIQRLMDLLDEEGESEDREEAERQHNKKLAELAEERLYHELRTGLEHQDRIKEIDDEIAEENRSWQLQQNDWAREAQKQAYQDQIDALKDKQKSVEKSSREEINQLKTQNDRKKQEMQKYYSEVETLLNDHTLDMLAALGSANEDMYQKGLELMRNYGKGLKDGTGEISTEMEDFFGGTVPTEHGNLPSGSDAGQPSYNPGPQQTLVATVSPNQVRNIGGMYTLPARTLAGLLGESAEWNQQRQQVQVGGKWFSPLQNDNGTTYLSIRQVAEALGYIVKYIGSDDSIQIWDKAHDGAKVLQTGAAVLKHDERVLSPQLTTSFDRLASILVKTPDITSRITGGDNADLDRVADRVIAAMDRRKLLVDKAVNIEHVEVNERADMQALGVEIRSMLTATG
jgi:hypothetical protein